MPALTDAQLEEMVRLRVEDRYTMQDLADHFGVSTYQIRKLRNCFPEEYRSCNCKAILTREQIDEMVWLRVEDGLSMQAIADHFGVSRYTIHRLWHHIPEQYQGKGCRPRSPRMTENQIEKMVHLRTTDKLSQRELAECLGVGRAAIQKHWHRIPVEHQGPYCRKKRRAEPGNGKFYRGLSDMQQCSGCGWIFDEANPKHESGVCMLCWLQKQGRVLLFEV